MLNSIAFSRLPSVENFTGRLTDDLSKRRSLLVLLPAEAPINIFRDLLREELSQRQFSYKNISLSDYFVDENPLISVIKNLHVDWSNNAPYTIENLLRKNQLPEIIILDDYEQLSEEAHRNWMSFLVQWARICQSWTEDRDFTTALCLIGAASPLLPFIPESNVYLDIHWWWGFPSTLEIHTLCRQNGQADDEGLRSRWREYILTSMVGGDYQLADDLWNNIHSGEESLLANLLDFAKKRGWTEDNLNRWGVEQFSIFYNNSLHEDSLIPPKTLRMLWANGVIGRTSEYGIELHAAVLAVLNRYDELKYRLWRGQVQLLLPLINKVRLRLCEILTHKYGSDWPKWYSKHFDNDDEYNRVCQNPLTCELGPLERILDETSSLHMDQSWFPLRYIRSIRNKIAHYEPIEFQDFEHLITQVNTSGDLPF